jgi:hypothetical protein
VLTGRFEPEIPITERLEWPSIAAQGKPTRINQPDFAPQGRISAFVNDVRIGVTQLAAVSPSRINSLISPLSLAETQFPQTLWNPVLKSQSRQSETHP